jgi:Uncharacterized protein conserved in bacteria (DUF2252)
MQAASGIMLGWVRTTGIDGVERDFYVRQLWDGKGSAIIEAMNPGTGTVRETLRLDARTRACSLGRCDRDCELPRRGAGV